MSPKKRKRKKPSGRGQTRASTATASPTSKTGAAAEAGFATATPWRFEPRWWVFLGAFFALALAPRLYTAVSYTAELEVADERRLVNYDQNNSCRGIYEGFRYPTFLGRQIIAIATVLGHPPPPGMDGPVPAAEYCQSQPLLKIGRSYSALAGSLTVVALGLLALLMWPQRPRIAWTACALLALSNFHVAQSHWATVDAPLVFYVTAMAACIAYGLVSNRRWPWILSLVFTAAAVLSKAYIFALFAYLPLLRRKGLNKRTLTIGFISLAAMAGLLALFGQEEVAVLYAKTKHLVWGKEGSAFGSGYGNIGTWRRWLRNALNLPLVHMVGLGIPACLLVYRGVRQAIADRSRWDLWLVHASAASYALYMLLLGPVTYYRHYLPLFPTVALLSAYGLWQSRWARHKVLVALFCLYPMLLTVDSELSIQRDPRTQLPAWFESQQRPRIMLSFYVAPPFERRYFKVFKLERYLEGGADYLRGADYVLLSECWYETALPNELNGPIAWNPEWLIKTRPEHVIAFRKILAGEDPNLELETSLDLFHFTPELMLHRWIYGSFHTFIGDIKIYRVRAPGS